MNKLIAIGLSLVALVIIIYFSISVSVAENPSPKLPNRDITLSLPSISLPSLDTFIGLEQISFEDAWTTLEAYLQFAKTHDLEGLRSLSHQVSDTCNDPTREEECFALMNSVYNIISSFKQSDFKNTQSDNRQLVMYTDGPQVAILFFTRGQDKNLKVLGMRFCQEDADSSGKKCVETDPAKRDLDNNGWWDNVESLFYGN